MNGKTITRSILWKFAERLCTQGVSFNVSIILARMLLPEDYGIISMILVFINIAEVFVSSGFNAALIQKKDADDVDFSTIFYCSILLSLFLYGLLYVLAPYIAYFYGQAELIRVLRVLGIRLLVNAYNSIQSAYVSRHMQFRKFFFSTIIGTLSSAIVGIYLAYRGAGYWALVAQYLCNAVVNTVVLSITIDWHPKLVFSRSRAKVLISFGGRVMVADFIGTLYNEMRALVIGRYYSSADLAYYNKAEQFPKLFADNILNTVSAVLFPALSNLSESKDRVREMTRTAIRSTCFLMFPLMTGLCVLADPLIRVVLTEKWLPSVPFLQLACISYAILPLNNTNVQAIKAMGKGATYLRIEMLKKIFGIFVIIVCAQISVMAVAISAVSIAFIYLLINVIPNGRLLGYGLRDQLIDVIPFAIYSLIMGMVVYFVGMMFSYSSIVSLLVQIVVGVLVYFGMAVVTRNKEVVFFWKLFSGMILRR